MGLTKSGHVLKTWISNKLIYKQVSISVYYFPQCQSEKVRKPRLTLASPSDAYSTIGTHRFANKVRSIFLLSLYLSPYSYPTVLKFKATSCCSFLCLMIPVKIKGSLQPVWAAYLVLTPEKLLMMWPCVILTVYRLNCLAIILCSLQCFSRANMMASYECSLL